MTPLSLMLLGWTASSCTSEEFKDQLMPGDGEPILAVSIGISAPTRSATGGTGTFEPGADLENYIDIANNDFRIYFFDSDNKYVATFHPSRKAEFSNTATSVNGVDTYYYTFEGKVPPGVGTKFKLVTLANWGKYPEENTDASYQLTNGETTLADLVTHAEAQFTHLASPGEDGEWLSKEQHRLIPFYGVRYYDLSTFDDLKNHIENGRLTGNVFVDLESDALALPLIRAMAKVEVILTNKSTSFSGVKMTKVNEKGFNSPYKSGDDWKFDYTDYFHEYEWDKDFVRGVHLVGGNNAPATADNGSLEFKKVQDHSDTGFEKWVAYVPEYKNIGVGEEFTAISLTLANPGTGDWGTHTNTIYFAPDGSLANNTDGAAGTTKRYDIERNNIYRFTITEMNAKMECQLDVRPYASCELRIDLGLSRDERGDLMILRDADGNLPEFFMNFMKEWEDQGKSKWPRVQVKQDDGTYIDSETLLEPQKLDPSRPDYYVIIPGVSGEINDEDTEVWLKNYQGYRVLSNYSKKDDNSEDCSTRLVRRFFGHETMEFLNDINGERRVFHYSNHYTIVLDKDDRMVYKDPDNKLRFEVESCAIEYDNNNKPIKATAWIILSKDPAAGKITVEKITEGGERSGETQEINQDDKI